MSGPDMVEPGTPTDALSWDDFLTERDKRHLRETTWGKSQPFGLGERPAVVVIDDYYSALGHDRKPLFESVKTWPMSCGLDGWNAIDRTIELLASAREHDVPVIYVHLVEELITTLNTRSGSGRSSMWDGMSEELRSKANEIVDEIAPRDGDLVLKKAAPSAFADTPLVHHLIHQKVDTLIVCGETTSGCVRASVVDSATYRFRTGIAGECCFDRTQASHHMSLFDMNQKYGDVMSNAEITKYFEQL